MRRLVGGLGVLAVMAGPLAAQGYRLRLDTRYQSVSFRGIDTDSVLASAVINPPGSGPRTADGFAVDCTGGGRYCYFYRPGARLRGQPMSTNADLTLWGLGVPGLTVHAAARAITDLSANSTWAGTEPNLQLMEGYAEYAATRLTARAGRQIVSGRLGYQGFDGALATLRLPRSGLDLTAYGGWGLARATALPVTSPALNPLDDFQPRDRQLMVGADVAFRHRLVDLRGEYRREVDPAVDYFVSERAAATADLHVAPRFRVSGGAEYDFANGWWGSAEASVNYLGRKFYLSAEGKRYRPFFDLWTIWGAFSPVPYRSIRGSGGVEPLKGLWIRGQAERYWFDNAEISSPLVTRLEDRGWRAGLQAVATLDPRWTLEGGYRIEFGPGASSRSFDGGLTFRPSDRWSVGVRGGTLDRPLEFRFSDAKVNWVLGSADVRLSSRFRVVSDLGWYGDKRNRPDAAAFDLNQVRVSTRLVMSFGSDADRLPSARRAP